MSVPRNGYVMMVDGEIPSPHAYAWFVDWVHQDGGIDFAGPFTLEEARAKAELIIESLTPHDEVTVVRIVA